MSGPRERDGSSQAQAPPASGHDQAGSGPQDGRILPAQRRPLYAALDLGTNNCRLLVARPEGASFRVVDAFSRIVRLGEGLAHSGRLDNRAMDRAVEALRICQSKIVSRGVVKARLIATEACRAASNGAEFLERVREKTGLELEIIDRATEARLASQGCAPLADPDARGVLLFDIGGGSSEIVWLTVRRSGKQGGPPLVAIKSWISLPVGVVTLAERHGGQHVTAASFVGMVDEVAAMLDDFPQRDDIRSNLSDIHLLGTSGTVTTLAGIHLDLPRYDRRQVDGAWLTAPIMDRVLDQLLAMSFEERAASPCIGQERADLVLAGCAILQAIRRHFPCDRLRVADRGLREGILVELMREDSVWRRRGHRPFPPQIGGAR